MELFHNPTVAWFYFPPVLLAMALEAALYSHQNHRFPWKDSLASLLVMAGHTLAGATSNTLITTGLAVLVWHYRLMTVDLGVWWHVALLFLLVDFAYYWYHRCAHRVRVMWGSHSAHHSPNEMTLSGAYRLAWTPILSGSWLFYLPLVWLGFDPAWVFGAVSLNLLYQFWLHTTFIPRLGVLEWVITTPSSHRVHHASNPEYLDRNYGGTLIVWDRLFGTYVPEDPTVAIRYGLVHPNTSRNPFVIVFREFHFLLRDLLEARSWRDRVLYLFAPPGWRPTPRDR